MQITPLMVDVDTAAALLSIGRTAVFEEIRRGRLKSVKRNKSRLIPVVALSQYVDLLMSETDVEEAA